MSLHAPSEAELRDLIRWKKHYSLDWDDAHDEYAANGVVQQGKSRRLGVLRRGDIKAYLGVQHVDPTRPGWETFGTAHCRFFVSVFISGRCVTLRTFPTMRVTLQALSPFVGEAE